MAKTKDVFSSGNRPWNVPAPQSTIGSNDTGDMGRVNHMGTGQSPNPGHHRANRLEGSFYSGSGPARNAVNHSQKVDRLNYGKK